MATTPENQEHVRIGVDLGGTKIEFIALERDGRELHRHRIATPRHDYDGTVRAIAEAVREIEKKLGRSATVGLGIPGTISTKTGLVKNANSTWLNGKPFDKDRAARWNVKYVAQMTPTAWRFPKPLTAPEWAGMSCLR